MIRTALLAAALAAVALPAASIQRSEIHAVGKTPTHVAADPMSGRVFVSNAGGGRGADGMSISILDAGGRATTIATSEPPGPIVVSSVHRKAVVLHPGGSYASVVDADTLQARTVMTGVNPSRTVIVERTGRAYVVGKGSGSGSITEIDLRSGLARTYPVPGISPESVVADPSGTRLFLLGMGPQRSEWPAAYVQVFDLQAKTVSSAPVPVGRLPREVLISPAGDALYVVTHVDHIRPELAPQDARRQGVRPAVVVLDSATLMTRRVVALPQAREPLFSGRAEILGDTLYLLDTANEQLLLVEPASSRVEAVELEAPGFALAVNAAARTLLVSMNTAGMAAVFSLSGQRLDTVPLARAAVAGEIAAHYDIALDPGSGSAWITNGHAGSVSFLKADRLSSPQVVSFTDLWSSPGADGWGVFIDHQGAALFATLFTYDTAGRPTWYFMSNGKRQADGAFVGELYRTRGALADAPRKLSGVGTMRFEPDAGGGAMLVYTIDGILHRRPLERFRFDASTRQCHWKVGPHAPLAERTNFTSLWSNPADPGWGLAVSHQGESTFAVLFTYDAEARPTWAVMSNGRRDAHGAFAGEVYRAADEKIEVAGQMSIAFTGADVGMLRYRLGGLDFRAPILRQVFSRLTTECWS